MVVARLDRLAWSTIALLHLAESLKKKQAGLQSLDEPWHQQPINIATDAPIARTIEEADAMLDTEDARRLLDSLAFAK